MPKKQLTDHEKWCLDIIERSGIKLVAKPTPGSLRRKPSKNHILYPLWLKQQQEQKESRRA